jgi:hypothetical protein
MKNTLWGPTLILNHVRAACAGLVWFVIMAFTGDPGSHPAQMLLLPVGYLIVLLPMSLISVGLSKIGFPFISWFPVILSLILLPGDPPTYIIHKFAPKLVPVQKYSFLNFTTIILAKDPAALP